MIRGSLAALTASALAFSCPDPTYGAGADPEPVKFEIRRFVLEGNTLLPEATIERLLAPHRGGDKDFADIQRALEALETGYRDIGYGIVQVTLPEQNITRGEIRFVIIQPRLGKVTVEGNKTFSTSNIRASTSPVPLQRELRARRRILRLGNAFRRSPQAGDSDGETIAAAGVGLRIGAGSSYSVRFDLARVTQAGGTQSRGDWRLHALLSAVF